MFIAFDGLDGCGKTTQIDMLKALNFKDVTFIKEPYHFNAAIKKCLYETEFISPVAHTFLFLACHAEAYAKWPKTKYIISDRSLYSTLAYTYGYNGDLANKVYNTLRMYTIDNFPQIIFYLKMPVPTIDDRLKYRKTKDKIESKNTKYFYRVNSFFNKLSEEPSNISKWIILDARQPPKIIHKRVMEVLAKEILNGNV